MKRLLMSIAILGFVGIPVGALGVPEGETGAGTILSCIDFALQDRSCRTPLRSECDGTALTNDFQVGILRPLNVNDGGLSISCDPPCVTVYGNLTTHVCVGRVPFEHADDEIP